MKRSTRLFMVFFIVLLLFLIIGCVTTPKMKLPLSIARTEEHFEANPTDIPAEFVDIPISEIPDSYVILGYVVIEEAEYNENAKLSLQPYVTAWGGDAVAMYASSNTGIYKVANFMILRSIESPEEDSAVAAEQTVETLTSSAWYWENGKAVSLVGENPEAFANEIIVSGSDVYIAGTIMDAETKLYTAYCLKNGVPMVLDITAGSESGANALFVSGKDVYVAGWMGGNAVYWKNGTSFTLEMDKESKRTTISDIFADNQNVHVVGFYSTADKSETIAVHWKNGMPTYLTDGSSYGKAHTITASGGTIYICGTNENRAVIWKNGEQEYLPNLPLMDGDDHVYADAFSLCLSGSNVYTVGEVVQTSRRVPVLWKNDTVSVLSDQVYFDPYQVFVSGSDVYLGGTVYKEEFEPECRAAIWKNGEITYMSADATQSYVTSLWISDKDIYAVGVIEK